MDQAFRARSARNPPLGSAHAHAHAHARGAARATRGPGSAASCHKLPQAAGGARLQLAGCHPRSRRVEGPLPATLTRLRPLVPGIPSGSSAACRLALPSDRLLPGSRPSFYFDRRFLPAGSVSTRRRQEADLRCPGQTCQGQRPAKPGNSHCRPSAALCQRPLGSFSARDVPCA
jgi:hypothetical protein